MASTIERGSWGSGVLCFEYEPGIANENESEVEKTGAVMAIFSPAVAVEAA